MWYIIIYLFKIYFLFLFADVKRSIELLDKLQKGNWLNFNYKI